MRRLPGNQKQVGADADNGLLRFELARDPQEIGAETRVLQSTIDIRQQPARTLYTEDPVDRQAGRGRFRPEFFRTMNAVQRGGPAGDTGSEQASAGLQHPRRLSQCAGTIWGGGEMVKGSEQKNDIRHAIRTLCRSGVADVARRGRPRLRRAAPPRLGDETRDSIH
jgi:hypothetical protein